MKKLIGIILGLLTLAPFIGIAFLFYVKLQSTPALIVILIVLMTGVMLAYFVYTKKAKNLVLDGATENPTTFPKIESGLIHVAPAVFCEKLEKTQGNLYLIGFAEPETQLSLVDGSYNKLTDETVLRFSDGIRLELKGVSTISVGNNQFIIKDAKEIEFIKGKQRARLQFIGKKVYISSGIQKEEIRIDNKGAKMLFEF
ncbi:MAG TPA: hypothetical protein VKX31_02275 [Brumimicrobium sp.]|nr:hypothetical protein [Brumimicrobium sp.]